MSYTARKMGEADLGLFTRERRGEEENPEMPAGADPDSVDVSMLEMTSLADPDSLEVSIFVKKNAVELTTPVSEEKSILAKRKAEALSTNIRQSMISFTNYHAGEEEKPEMTASADPDSVEVSMLEMPSGADADAVADTDSAEVEVSILGKRNADALSTNIRQNTINLTKYPGVASYTPSYNSSSDDLDTLYKTWPFVEVFSVQVCLDDNNAAGADERGVYGQIHMDGMFLFNRQDRDNYERLYPDEDGFGWCTLTPACYGPINAEVLYHNGLVKLMDKDHDFDQIELEDYDGFSSGYFAWVSRKLPYNPFTNITRLEFRGQEGSARINLQVYEHAIRADVEITLLSFKQGSNDQSTADVCGTVKVFPEGYSSDHESLLFRRRMDAEDDVTLLVSPTEKIPLLRSCVAVPLKKALFVKADLVDRANRGTQIACGTAAFPFTMSPEPARRVIGDSRYGEIEITVHWIKGLDPNPFEEYEVHEPCYW